MRNVLFRGCAALVSLVLIIPSAYPQVPSPVAPVGAQSASGFSAEQLDALLAPIALYPDPLLAQVLMASTYPLQIVDASRWLAEGTNKSLTGDALAKALEPKTWDPSVKSLMPFPQVLEMMNQNLDWTQQLGYVAATQQNEVMDSVQRLRRQAQQAGTLQTTEQQVVTTNSVTGQGGAPPQQVIVIEPSNPQVVYVPTYNPAQVYGTWPYSTPPVYLPPPPGYAIGNALLTGMAFAAGAAVVGSLWGWARPSWGYGYGGGWGGSINVNTNRYNNITVNNVNRGSFNNGRWQAPPQAPGRIPNRPPPNGPVGRPGRGNGIPPNAIGRPSVSVPGGAVNRPNIPHRPPAGAGPGSGAIGQPGGRPGPGNLPAAGGSNRPNGGPGSAATGRPGSPNGQPSGRGPGAIQRPGASQPPSANRPSFGQGSEGPIHRPAPGAGAGAARPGAGQQPAFNRPATRPAGGGAFGGLNDGARAGQFQQRGAQSRSLNARPSGGGGQRMGGGAGGGGRRGGGRR